jgi:hypothetical protein
VSTTDQGNAAPPSQPGSATVTDAGTTPAQPAATPAPADPSAPKEEREARPDLTEALRTYREGSKKAKAEAAKAAALESKVKELETQLNKSAAKREEILLDPVGYLEELGIKGKDVALVGEMLMYHLLPDKAPPDLRARAVTAQQERREREREAKRQQEAAEAQQAQLAERENLYRSALGMAVQSVGEDDFPTSQDWFDGSQEEWQESLWHTANNMAVAAQEDGRVADLSTKAVMAELDKFLTERKSRSRKKAAAPTPSQSSAPPADTGKKKENNPQLPATGQGLNSSGAPKTKAQSENERIARAIEALDRMRR